MANGRHMRRRKRKYRIGKNPNLSSLKKKEEDRLKEVSKISETKKVYMEI